MYFYYCTKLGKYCIEETTFSRKGLPAHQQLSHRPEAQLSKVKNQDQEHERQIPGGMLKLTNDRLGSRPNGTEKEIPSTIPPRSNVRE